MKQIFEEKDLINKMIVKTGYANNAFALFFSDNTYAIFRGCGYEENDVELVDNIYSLDPTTSNAYELRDMGVITQKEYDRVWKEHSDEKLIEQEEREKYLYEKLKLKYERPDKSNNRG